MAEDIYTPEQVAVITDYVDVTAPPTGVTAHFVFGTNQVAPIELVADRYRQGLAPLIIVTGGVNRHDGVVEGQEFRRRLVEMDVGEGVIRCEDRSASTWQNVEFALSYLREAVASGLRITAVCKWYHRRAIHCLRTLLPEAPPIHAVTFEPVYSGVSITRANWIEHPDGKRRVVREWRESARRVADGSFADLNLVGGAWQ